MFGKRLLACADFVRKNAYVCDVGCDHAYLPCFLVEKGITDKVIAADVNEMPLEGARKNIVASGYGNKISTMISNGLLDVPINAIDDIIIAGMGGELILKIINDSVHNIGGDKNLILQPMTHIPVLRRGLYAIGFEITDESAVFEKGHWYTIIQAKFTGHTKKIDDVFANVGAHMHKTCDENSCQYLKHIFSKNKGVLENLKKSNTPDEDKLHEYTLVVNALETIISEM